MWHYVRTSERLKMSPLSMQLVLRSVQSEAWEVGSRNDLKCFLLNLCWFDVFLWILCRSMGIYGFHPCYAERDTFGVIDKFPMPFDRRSVRTIEFSCNSFCQSRRSRLCSPACYTGATVFGGKREKTGRCIDPTS